MMYTVIYRIYNMCYMMYMVCIKYILDAVYNTVYSMYIICFMLDYSGDNTMRSIIIFYNTNKTDLYFSFFLPEN